MDPSNNNSSSRKTNIDPEIQEQIKYIAAKARANGTGNDNISPTIVSQKRTQFEDPSLVTNDIRRCPQAPSLSYSGGRRWKQMQTLAQVTDVLTTVVQYSQELFDKTAGTLQYEAQALEDIFNDIAPAPINGHYPPIPYLQNLLGSRRNILNAMNELEKMGTAIHDARLSITKDLEKVNLMDMAPDWHDFDHFEGNGVALTGTHL